MIDREDIIRMAREAGLVPGPSPTSMLERFAALVAAERDRFWQTHIEPQIEIEVAAEREACAKVVEQTKWSNWFQADAAAGIRARGNSET